MMQPVIFGNCKKPLGIGYELNLFFHFDDESSFMIDANKMLYLHRFIKLRCQSIYNNDESLIYFHQNASFGNRMSFTLQIAARNDTGHRLSYDRISCFAINYTLYVNIKTLLEQNGIHFNFSSTEIIV